LAIDPLDGDLYVSVSGQGLSRYAAGCSMPCDPVATFGQGYLGYGYINGVAVDALDHVVFALGEGRRGVGVFVPPGLVPEVTTGPSALASQRVIRVEGSVDPAGAGDVTGCHFEYVDLTTFYGAHFTQPRSVPCEPAPPYSGVQHVSGLLSDLEGGTAYRYRVVATNSRGPGTGIAQAFRTGTMAEAKTGAASVVDKSSASLSGSVVPSRSAVLNACFFEYVEQRYALRSGFQTAQSAPCTPPPPYGAESFVSALVTRLSPVTTYRYRLTAWDGDGVSNGSERSFTTPAEASAPIDPGEPETTPPRRRHRRHLRNIHCLKRACSRTFTASPELQKWISPRFPPDYGWLFSIHKDGRSLAHTRAAGGCISTFTGRGMIATLNGCRGRFTLTYIGTGGFSIRWRVFEFCRCADNAKRRW
jgi:hypothetical protein